MTREQAHKSCLSRDCSCISGKDRDNNYHETIDKIFDYFETKERKTCEGCVFDDGVEYKAVCQSCVSFIRKNYTKSC
jgi:hypothetical protein